MPELALLSHVIDAHGAEMTLRNADSAPIEMELHFPAARVHWPVRAEKVLQAY